MAAGGIVLIAALILNLFYLCRVHSRLNKNRVAPKSPALEIRSYVHGLMVFDESTHF